MQSINKLYKEYSNKVSKLFKNEKSNFKIISWDSSDGIIINNDESVTVNFSFPATPTVTGAIAQEVLKEALSKPSDEAKKRNDQASELLKQLRS